MLVILTGQTVLDVTGSLPYYGLLPVLLNVTEDCCKILGVGEQTDDVDVVASFEVEPAARKPCEPVGSQTGNAAQLAYPRGARARHPFNRSQRLDRRVEEPSAKLVAALVSVIPDPLY